MVYRGACCRTPELVRVERVADFGFGLLYVELRCTSDVAAPCSFRDDTVPGYGVVHTTNCTVA